MNGRMANYEVIVREETLENELIHSGKRIMSYSIAYPQFESRSFPRRIANLNAYYQLQARKYALHCEKRLFPMALEQYDYSVRNRLPIQEFEARRIYEVTYNQNCAISLYTDTYEYLGGAHGNTIRTSDTWNLNRGGRYELYQLFPNTRDLKNHLIAEIVRRIEKLIEQGDSSYFDEYEENAAVHFDSNNFYLTNRGVVIYFQKYDIAPYAKGFPEFLFTYRGSGAVQPVCMLR